MKKQLLNIGLCAIIYLSSCVKAPLNTTVQPALTTNNIIVPAGFKWNTSNNINLTVNITDLRYQQSLYFISVFDGNPLVGANLLARGSATNSVPFKGKFILTSDKKQLYIVKMAPDNNETIQSVVVNNFNLAVTMGQ